MKRIIISLLALPAILTLTACGGDDATREWRFAIEEIQGSVQHRYAERFEELVEERSGGEIQVSVYPYGALGTSSQLTELVQKDAIQLAFASPGHLGSVVPEVQIFSLHFVFSDDEAVNQKVLTESEELRSLLDEAYRERGLELLAVVQEGWMVWTADRALAAPEDFTGLKIRTMASPLLLDAYNAYGANPTPMPYAEVYGGLQLNMIDAQVNPVFAIEEMSFYEVQDYMVFADHLPFIATVVTSPEFYQGLAPETREMLDGVLADLDDYVFGVQEQFNRERLDQIRERSDIEVVRLDEEQRERFRQASLPVRERYVELAGDRGRQILDTLLAEVAKHEGDGSAEAAAAEAGAAEEGEKAEAGAGVENGGGEGAAGEGA